ncbi:MAG: type II toxin-antitoxin system RelE/ParE family toxin [Shewanella sp.]
MYSTKKDDTGMIQNIIHKGLRSFVETGNTAGIPQDLIKRLRPIITTLNTAINLQDIMDVRSLRCHELKGNRQGEYAVDVSGNWRVVFKFQEPNVLDVNLEDYH